MKVGINLDGFQSFIDAVSDLETEFQRLSQPILRDAVDAGAEIAADEARRRAKYLHDTGKAPNKSGAAVYENIVVRRARISREGTVYARVGVNRKAGYATPLEYGHVVRTREGYKMVAAYPFFWPAFECKRFEIRDAIGRRLVAGIPKLMADVARRRIKRAGA